MYQSRNFREGVRSQAYAEALLQKIAFLAQPVVINDDIGIDYYCTLIELKKLPKDWAEIPSINFSIQIKSESDRDKIDLANLVQALKILTTPYFIGLMDKAEQKLEIYSGHYLTPFFSLNGIDGINKLMVELVPEKTITGLNNDYFENSASGEFVIRFPLVATLTENLEMGEIEEIIANMQERCILMSQNIASAILEEHMFANSEGNAFLVNAGKGSLPFFERNLFKRLAVSFFNLQIAFSNSANIPAVKERFPVFEKVYVALAEAYSADPNFQVVTHFYENAKRVISP